jgi:hypothetical protein
MPIHRSTVLLALTFLVIAPSARADVRTEASALQATKKAQKDFVSAKYAAGIAKLQGALKACGTNRCSDEVRAHLLRDMGAQQFRKGDKKGSKKSWSNALALVPNLTLSATYDSPDAHDAFEDAKVAQSGAARGGRADAAVKATVGGPSGAGEGEERTKGDSEATANVGRVEETVAGGEGEAKPSEEPGAGNRKVRRLWIGISATLDFGHLPSGQDLCKLDPSYEPYNTGDYYCTYDSGADFPSRNPSNPTNTLLQPGQAGNVSDRFAVGNARLLASFDYAIHENVLLGLRAGLVFFAYPGGSPTLGVNETSGAAFNDGKAFKPSWLHLELRATYVFGSDPLLHVGLSPIVFLGGGLAEFDQHASDTVTLSDGLSGPVRIWRTDGPLFFMVGGGVRLGITDAFAITAAIRANLAVSPVFMPTVGPEMGFQYGL